MPPRTGGGPTTIRRFIRVTDCILIFLALLVWIILDCILGVRF